VPIRPTCYPLALAAADLAVAAALGLVAPALAAVVGLVGVAVLASVVRHRGAAPAHRPTEG
jgi:hypothetical protein